MERESVFEKLRDCKVIKRQIFVTERGRYSLTVWANERDIYLLKMKDGKIVELNNLTEMAAKR